MGVGWRLSYCERWNSGDCVCVCMPMCLQVLVVFLSLIYFVPRDLRVRVDRFFWGVGGSYLSWLIAKTSVHLSRSCFVNGYISTKDLNSSKVYRPAQSLSNSVPLFGGCQSAAGLHLSCVRWVHIGFAECVWRKGCWSKPEWGDQGSPTLLDPLVHLKTWECAMGTIITGWFSFPSPVTQKKFIHSSPSSYPRRLHKSYPVELKRVLLDLHDFSHPPLK